MKYLNLYLASLSGPLREVFLKENFPDIKNILQF